MLESIKERIQELGVLEVSNRTKLSRSTLNNFVIGRAALTSTNLEKVMKALFFELKPVVPNLHELMSRVPCDPKKADQILKLAQILKSTYKPKKIILFGSQARGDWKKDSDIDLMVVGFNQEVDAGEYYVQAFNAGITAGFDVVMVSEEKLRKYQNEKSSVYFNALKDGIVIHV